jgi:hypothetical protein
VGGPGGAWLVLLSHTRSRGTARVTPGTRENSTRLTDEGQSEGDPRRIGVTAPPRLRADSALHGCTSRLSHRLRHAGIRQAGERARIPGRAPGRLRHARPRSGGSGLSVLVCGSNPSLWSGAVGLHLAGPSNRRWPTLHASGWTPRRPSPSSRPWRRAGSRPSSPSWAAPPPTAHLPRRAPRHPLTPGTRGLVLHPTSARKRNVAGSLARQKDPTTFRFRPFGGDAEGRHPVG